LRVFLFAAVLGERRQMACNLELLYVCALYHCIGLTDRYKKSKFRFEVDGADAARQLLSNYAIPEHDVTEAWTAIALQSCFGITEHMSPLIALVAQGIEVDLFGMHLVEFSKLELAEILERYPRDDEFKVKIIDAMARGIEFRPHSAFGNIQADALERVDPKYRRTNFCGLVLGSGWAD
jgi:hypothetical protein